MRVGVLGAGSIGTYLGGRLLAAGVPTTLVGRAALADAVARHGLRLTDYRGFDVTLPPARVPIATTADALADCDWVLVTVKGLDTAAAAAELAPVLRRDAVVVSFQNGVGNPAALRAALGPRQVLAGMVPFNVLRRSDAHVHQGTSGRLAVEAMPDQHGKRERHPPIGEALTRAGLLTLGFPDMRPILWGKLLVNLNNSINALCGLPLAEQLAQRGYRRLMAACFREGLAVVRRAGIKPRIDAPLPPSLLPLIMELPDFIFHRLSGSLVTVDRNARSSMWEDLARGRRTEIDLLNGEIVRLGAELHRPTPLNAAIVRLIKEAEGHGSPSLSAPDLLGKLTADG